MYKQAKRIAYRLITASDMVERVPCFLHGVFPTPKDNKRTDVKVYDGHDDNGVHVMTIGTGTGITNPCPFTPPLFFNHGIYLVCDGDILNCLVQWKPDDRPDRFPLKTK